MASGRARSPAPGKRPTLAIEVLSADSPTWKDAIELQMPYQEAFDEIKENTRLVLENR
ncbi:uncharacterized protein LOC119767761 isoform X3 [Culex quinquefasciatus]|uniref:uncharacterized protein LOC119767761 isoform X3 n=1 Tax=Culex quinquefasciatus TaxID=7176 RepID=UPI0018E2A94F|nr:uncharacterized protein LOC119767761 isoform X3 [Culex quinquefasciatus]